MLLFLLLQNGIVIQNFSLQNLKVKQLYIKWNEKLILQAKEISLDSNKNRSQDTEAKIFRKTLAKISLLSSWFEEISLETISYRQIKGSLYFKEGQAGSLKIENLNFALDAQLYSWKKKIYCTINSLEDKKRNISLEGDLVIDTKEAYAFSLLQLAFDKKPLGTLAFHAMPEQLHYALEFHKRFSQTKELLSLIDLPKEIHFWARDAIKLESLELLYCHGDLLYDKAKDFYKTIHIKAKAHKLDYTYNPKLDSIHTQTTLLQFKEGILSIYPQEAYSYGMFLDKSWLQIDFTQKEEILTLYLLFETSLKKEILHILQTYKIQIPFYQHSGSVLANLRLQVNLMTIDVDAKGNFYTKEGNFDYQKMNLDVSNLRVFLDNYKIKINNMNARYQDLASALVNVDYNARNGEGKISLAFDSIALEEYGLFLKNSKEVLDVTYSLSPKKSILSVAPSQWSYFGELLHIEALEFPFDIETLEIKLDPTHLDLASFLSVQLQGEINLLHEKAALQLTLLDLDYKGLSLAMPKYTLKLLHQNKQTTLLSDDTLALEYKKIPLKLATAKLEHKNNLLTLQSKKFQSNNLSVEQAFLQYDTDQKNGFLNLAQTHLQNDKAQTLFEKEKLLFRFNQNEDTSYTLKEEELALQLRHSNHKSELFLHDITKLIYAVAPLRDLKIDAGQARFTQNEEDIYTNITLQSPYAPLVKDGIVQKNYTINGILDLQNEQYNFHINDTLDLFFAKEITINAKNTGLRLNGIIQILDALKKEKTDTNTTQKIVFHGKNTPIVLSDTRKILADELHLKYENETLEALLLHQDARADLRWHKKELTLYGDNFNDNFMQNLFAISKFKGGNFTFSMDGEDDIYNGVFRLSNTNILEYTLLNNIFAFVNTLPALTTLSFPKYSKEGLFVKDGFVQGTVNTKEHAITLKDIYLESNELKLVGNGEIDYKQETLDLLLNINTNIADKISKIPLVGYLLFDGESVSTTLSVSGTLQDPKVRSHLAKDIIIAPLNIIKRTLFLPYHLFKEE